MESKPTSSSNLEQFLILAKAAKGAAAVSLIKQVLEVSNVYVFGEFLDLPNIKELEENAEHSLYYRLLKLFAYGTCKEYAANKSQLPEITTLMVKKLRLLTLASLAAKDKHLSYSVLLNELDVHNLRELEDLIIEAIYAGVIKARLDQKGQKIEVQYALGRDVEPSQIPQMLELLKNWSEGCKNVLSDIHSQIVVAQDERAAHFMVTDKTEQEIENLKKTLKLTSGQERISTRQTETMDTSDSKLGKKPLKTKGLRGSGTKILKTNP